MNVLIRLVQILFLFAFYIAGSWLRDLLHLPLPGSIVGLLLLWIGLSTNIFSLKWIESGAFTLLAVLPLFFIPAMIAVINYGQFFAGKGMLLIVITIVSTFITMGVASYSSQTVAKRINKRKAGSDCS